MEFSCDDIFVIGDGHKVCEDYSWSGMIQNQYPCAIISDGCSSSVLTDIGARVLVMSTAHILRLLKLEKNRHEDNFNLITGLLDRDITQARNLLGLPYESFDATLLMVIIIDGKIFMMNYGDGSVVLRNHTTGEIKRHYDEYPFNAPYYFNYTLDDGNSDRYIELFGDQKVITDGMEIDVKDHVLDRNMHWSIIDLEDLTNGTWTVSVMSDGVETFFEGNDKIDFGEVLNGITDFKNFRGEYVQRKVGKYLKGLAKKNIQHYDDISVASIKFEVNSDNIE